MENGTPQDVQPKVTNEQSNPESGNTENQLSAEEIASLQEKAGNYDKLYEENGSLKRQLKKSEGKKADNPKKSDDGELAEFDYGQKAYLIANDVKSKEQQELAMNIVRETGKELEDVVNSDYFKFRLKEFNEETAAKNAIPKSGDRQGDSGVNSVDYWFKKNEGNTGSWELPSDPDLRREVVKARNEKSKSSRKFFNS